MPGKFYRLLTVVTLSIANIWFAGVVHADIFQSVDTNGIIHLSNVPSSTDYQLVLREARACKVHKTHKHLKKRRKTSKDFKAVVTAAAREQKLDQALLQAVIAVESAFNPRAVSSDGAVGLMQLMPDTAKRYGVADRYDPAENVRGGAHYLHDLIEQFHDNLPLALAAYNAGEDAVTHYGNRIPPYAETRKYVPRVLSLYKQYRSTAP